MNRVLLSATAAVAALFLGACGGTEDPGPATGLPGVEETAGDAPADDEVDACALLTDDEVTEVLGAHERERFSAGASCEWTNADHASVTLEIGSPGTASGGVVPPDEMLGDGERGADGVTYHSGGYTTFPVGDRACAIQVVVSVTDQSDRSTIDRFVALVRDRL